VKSLSKNTFVRCYIAEVPKLGLNNLQGVTGDSSRGNAAPKPQCCSMLCAITAILRVTRHIRYLCLGNDSNKFGKHCCMASSSMFCFMLKLDL